MSEAGDRQRAADLLRAARRQTGDAALEAAAWARSLAPQSLAAVLLEIDLALRAGDHHHADALLAQGLLARPDDPRLLVVQAKRLLDRGLPGDAARAIEQVVQARPAHVRTRMLAAEIAMRGGRLERAIDHFEAAAAKAPRRARDAAIARVFEAQLVRGDLRSASRALRRLSRPDPLLHARILKAEGAIPDAIHLLERHLESAPADSSDRDLILADLLDACDAARDDARILRHVENLSTATPRAQTRAALALLRMGRFAEARACATAVRDDAESRALADVALLMQRGGELPPPNIDNGRTHHVQPAFVASVWRRAFLGRLLNEIRDGRGGRAESPLALLLEWSRGVFAEADRDDEIARRHRFLCDAALSARE
jgi:tetratricopeptide (TPR) repeat protein